MDIKLIVLDLDGTTLKNKWKIHEDNLKIIKKVNEEKPDVKVVIATGRGPKATINHAKTLNIDQTSKHIICYNGGNIINLEEGKQNVLYQNALSKEQVEKVFEIAKKHNLSFWGYGVDNESAYLNKHSLKVWIVEKFNKLEIIKVKEGKEIGPLYKILLFYKNKHNFEQALHDLEQHKDLELSSSSFNVIEVNPIGVNKSNAVQFLCEKWKITSDQVLACGDGMNDYKLIKWAKYGIAMENGHENLKIVAHDVTTKNTKGGVAAAIEKYVFPKQ